MVSDPIEESLLAIIAEKKKALKPAKKVGSKTTSAPTSNVVNIMDALRKSVEADLKGARRPGDMFPISGLRVICLGWQTSTAKIPSRHPRASVTTRNIVLSVLLWTRSDLWQWENA